jgi:hypothetical protein
MRWLHRSVHRWIAVDAAMSQKPARYQRHFAEDNHQNANRVTHRIRQGGHSVARRERSAITTKPHLPALQLTRYQAGLEHGGWQARRARSARPTRDRARRQDRPAALTGRAGTPLPAANGARSPPNPTSPHSSRRDIRQDSSTAVGKRGAHGVRALPVRCRESMNTAIRIGAGDCRGGTQKETGGDACL